jgi:hypothetical protein
MSTHIQETYLQQKILCFKKYEHTYIVTKHT